MEVESLIERELRIPYGRFVLFADLVIPAEATGLVLFAHGSGSGRLSSRNRYVAEELNEDGFATVLADLLTDEEEKADRIGRQFRFDIALLTDRIVHITDWLRVSELTADLPLGLFGASTGAAAALDAAATRPSIVRAVVSRGGRPDLATRLRDVHAPTLFIVGGNDNAVLRLNQQALHALSCFKRLDVVPGATHLFEEVGALEHVATLARSWFTEYLK